MRAGPLYFLGACSLAFVQKPPQSLEHHFSFLFAVCGRKESGLPGHFQAGPEDLGDYPPPLPAVKIFLRQSYSLLLKKEQECRASVVEADYSVLALTFRSADPKRRRHACLQSGCRVGQGAA
jgi:hypothetical protein